MGQKRIVLLIVTALLLGGCGMSGMPPSHTVATTPPPPPPAPAGPASPGSLWPADNTSMFSDPTAHRLGDILTVLISETASASKEASTATSRKSGDSAGISNFFGLEHNLTHLNHSLDPSNLVGTDYQTDFKGSGSTSRKENLVATLTTQVVAVLPNGNLRIEGTKTVTVNNEEQIIRLTGVVRPQDITSGNYIDSQNILDARIAYTGKGVVSGRQSPGWLTNILDSFWPF
ncbi:MAG TPA: flagellar basal body L-ring protein FlgH [Desulfuromonadales bacterium]|nr:flagellar basal body L-ring protein FlgH [Desulfuromonadales bacterium]